jgi:hypothetical protein
MVKVEWLSNCVLLIPSSVGLANGQVQYAGVEFFTRPANGNQRPAELTNKKEIIMTNLVKRSGLHIYRKK